MRKLFILAALLITFTSQAQWRIDRLDNNTLVHISVGVNVGNITSTFGYTPKQRIILGFTSGTIIGLTKEIYDINKGQYAQVYDVMSTAAGGVLGAMMVNWIIKRNKQKVLSKTSNNFYTF